MLAYTNFEFSQLYFQFIEQALFVCSFLFQALFFMIQKLKDELFFCECCKL